MHDLLATLAALDLPRSDYVILGSGPLWAHGLIASPGDLDVLARGAAWAQALTLAPARTGERGDRIVTLGGGRIEIFDGWAPMAWDINAVIDRAEWFHGFPFARIEYVLAFKRALARPKDLPHIAVLERYLGERTRISG